jgi:hypothetical protein
MARLHDRTRHAGFGSADASKHHFRPGGVQKHHLDPDLFRLLCCRPDGTPDGQAPTIRAGIRLPVDQYYWCGHPGLCGFASCTRQQHQLRPAVCTARLDGVRAGNFAVGHGRGGQCDPAAFFLCNLDVDSSPGGCHSALLASRADWRRLFRHFFFGQPNRQPIGQ